MGMRFRDGILVVASVFVCISLLGCHAAPMTYSAADLQSAKTRARVAHLYWARNNVPARWEQRYRRVAIVDFSVEYVTAKIEVPGEQQPTFSPPAVAPAQIGIEFGGLFRKQSNYEPSLYQELADELHAMFTSELATRGFELLPAAEICGARAYQRLRTQERDDGSILQEFNLIGSDAGRVKQMVTYPATGYRIVSGAGQGDIEDVELALLDELGADVALRIHVRVGVYHGRASVERGSIIWVLARDVVGNLTAEKSLLSDELVVEAEGFVPIQGQACAVDSRKYLEALRQLFPPYISMAFESGGE